VAATGCGGGAQGAGLAALFFEQAALGKVADCALYALTVAHLSAQFGDRAGHRVACKQMGEDRPLHFFIG
jgi:hypothetical protein